MGDTPDRARRTGEATTLRTPRGDTEIKVAWQERDESYCALLQSVMYFYIGHGDTRAEAIHDLAQTIAQEGNKTWEEPALSEVVADIHALGEELDVADETAGDEGTETDDTEEEEEDASDGYDAMGPPDYVCIDCFRLLILEDLPEDPDSGWDAERCEGYYEGMTISGTRPGSSGDHDYPEPSFSWSACDCCGNSTAGYRYPIWSERVVPRPDY